MGKFFTISLGPSHAIDISKLRAAVRRLTDKHVQTSSSLRSVKGHAASRVPVLKPGITTGFMHSFMRTKLYRPPSSRYILPRTRLIERLHTALGCEITLVCAPAGFGKTTLLAQWVLKVDCPHAWLSLDEQDNELPVFVHSLVASLQTAFPDAFTAAAALLKA